MEGFCGPAGREVFAKMAQTRGVRNAVRLLLAGLVIGLGAYWAGSRYGPKQPVSVAALPLAEAERQRDASTPRKRKMSASTS